MKTRFRRVLLGLAGMVVLCLAGAILEFVVLRGRTSAIAAPGSVTSLENQRIGGVDQWVLIRGHDPSKPVLLFLHGGPGMPAMYLAHKFQSELERDFVVVHWDRRGAGKSYNARLDTSAITVRQTLSDTYELTERLRVRFHQQRIYLVGHSWGSYLGLLAVREHPEYYTAFIGMGQLAGTREEVDALRRAFLGQVAKRAGDWVLQARLADASAPITEDDLFRYGGELHGSRSFWPILKAGLGAPEYTLRDALNVKQGANWVGREMKCDVTPRPLDGEIRRIDVPVFFFLGRHDLNTPSQLAVQYLDRLNAPLKRVVWFEESAHFPFFEQPDRFHKEMLRAAESAAEFWAKRSQSEVTRRAQPSPH